MSTVHTQSRKLMEIAVSAKTELIAPRADRGALVQLFFNVNMGKSHGGLKLVAKEHGLDLDVLIPGQYVGFLNRKRTKIKLFSAGNIFAYLALPEDQQVTMEIISQIPQVFQSRVPIIAAPVFTQALEEAIPLSASEMEQEKRLMQLHRRGRQ